MEPAEYALAVGMRLRAVRMALGWSLADAEEQSWGNIKAVVISSYERADRGVTISRLAEIADLYQVPVASLLPPEEPRGEEVLLVADAIRESGMSVQDGKHVVRVVRKMLAAGMEQDAVPA
jgi:transcriptional regulator with XRE-family HTH domain